jgi:small subunit ribosomal protein S4
MAKIDMGRARFKIQRRLGVELPGLGKAGALERKPYGPGQHGMQRKKLSDYTRFV